MFNLANLKIEKRSDNTNSSSFVGIRRNNDTGELVFRLPLGFDSFPEDDFNEVKSLFFKMYRTFKKFEKDNYDNNNKDIQDEKPSAKDNTKSSANGYRFTDKEESDVILYSKIAVIEKIIEIYDDLVINSIKRHVSRSELIDFSKIDKYLHQAVYLSNHTVFIDEMNLPKNTIKLESSNLIELYCFILAEIMHELEQDIDSHVIEISNKFKELHLSNDQSIFNEQTFEITINVLKEQLDDIDKNTAYKDDDYWMIYEAIETFLYGELDMSCTNEDGIFWGINNFYQVWEDMCNTWAFKKENFNILYADTNIKINGNQVSNKKIGGCSVYCKENFNVPFFIGLREYKRWMRPDLVRFHSMNNIYENSVNIVYIKKHPLDRVDFKVIKKPNCYDTIHDDFIKRLKSKLSGKTSLMHGARYNTSKNIFTNYDNNILQEVINNMLNTNSSYMIIDWKYHDELFFKYSSDKLKKDITKQLCYEFTMSESLNNYKIKTQFVIPNFEKNTDNIGDNIENASLFTTLKSSGIVVFKANFFMIQQAYLKNDE